MSAEKTLLAGIASVLTAAGAVAKVNGGPRLFLAKLGWDLPPGVSDIGLAGLDLERAGTKLTSWMTLAADPESSSEDEALALLELAGAVIDALDELRDIHLQAPQDYLDKTGIKKEFLTRLLDLYLIQSAAVASSPVFDIAVLLGWFELQKLEADPSKFQVAHLRHVVHWDRLPQFFTDPSALMKDTYGWGTASFDSDALVTRLGAVLQHIAAEAKFRTLPAIPLARLHGGTLPPATKPQIQLFLPLLGTSGPVAAETGISVFGLPPTAPAGTDGGIGIAPYATGTANLRIRLSSTVSIGMSAKADLGSGLALVLRPGKDPLLRTGLNQAQAGIGSAGAEVNFDLTLAPPKDSQAMTLLTVGESTIEAASVTLAAGAVVDNSGTDAVVGLHIKGGKLTLKPDGLPFLDSVASDGMVIEADLDLSWSHRNGVRLGGRAELKTTIPIGKQIGPLIINAIAVDIATSGGGLALTAGLDATVKLGPVSLVIEGVGVRSAITPGPGNLGSADLSVRPAPPTGLGIIVDSPSVTGGGFLHFDTQKGEYSGVLELVIQDKISVKGFGLLSTRLPGGAKGYSFIIIIFVEGFTPIQMGLGFAITGIGGLLAINRTFDEEALRGGLKNHALDSVMFPPDPIRNAAQILSNINKLFPAASAHYLFGPTVQIGWPTPALITADLALVLEFGTRLRLLMLAQVVAILPRRENDLVHLQMDAVGVVDFDRGTASLDATLFDSRLLKKFALTGDMAMRLSWKSAPNFALAIGGLHPAFNPPANFPKLERIAINLSSGDNPRLRCEAYFALTSNTVQFGARAELYASASGFSIHGDIGFDVLIQFDPFFFIADFHAQLQLKRGSTNLFKLRFEGSLSGPRPLYIKGKATFEILWWDVTVRVDRTLVEGEKPPPPAPIEVLPRLKEALGNTANWTSQLPGSQRQLVTLRANAGQEADVLLHPLGSLTVRQNVVPLNLDISRFGQAAPAGARRFTINRVTMGADSETPTAVNDFFAPAQFLELTDDAKLSRPSFESMNAGVSFGVGESLLTPAAGECLEVKAIEFETWILDQETNELRHSEPAGTGVKSLYQLTRPLLTQQARFGAAGNSPIRRSVNAKYSTAIEGKTVGKYRIAKEGWSIVSTIDLTVQAVAGMDAARPASYTEAEQALQSLAETEPLKAARFNILRPSELVK